MVILIKANKDFLVFPCSVADVYIIQAEYLKTAELLEITENLRVAAYFTALE